MAGEPRKRERLRAERVARAHKRETATLKRRRMLYLFGALAAIAAIAAIAVLLSTAGGDGGENGMTPPQAAEEREDPFGPHYSGLEERRKAAGVPTMHETADSTVHLHPLLAVYVDGQQIEVPPNIGVDPNRPPMEMAGLHTHDAGGVIHAEGTPGTLRQFFAVWGVEFSKDHLGPYRSGGGRTVRMWVNGKPSDLFGNLQLADGQKIIVTYGPASDPRPRPKWPEHIEG